MVLAKSISNSCLIKFKFNAFSVLIFMLELLMLYMFFCRWSPDEDANLIRAVLAHGEKWSKIRDLNLVPGRNDAQMRER